MIQRWDDPWILVLDGVAHAGWRETYCGRIPDGRDSLRPYNAPKGSWAEVTCLECLSAYAARRILARDEEG